ncbi:hypothetical protein LAZ67_3003768, partial [Cordylochernes scorpioides]
MAPVIPVRRYNYYNRKDTEKISMAPVIPVCYRGLDKVHHMSTHGTGHDNHAARDDVTLSLPAGSSSNGAARVLGNWADCIEDSGPGADNDFIVVKTKKRRRESSNSPTAAAPSSNIGGARSSRRTQSSARSVPRAQKIPTTRAHIAEARARQASSAEEHCVYLEHGHELQPFHYLRALDRLLGETAGVVQVSKVNGHQLLGLANRGLAERLINNGLEVEGTLLRAFPFHKRAERITVGNLPFFVEESAIIKALGPYGRITSIAPKIMKAGPYTYTDGRREAFIILHEGVTTERLPTRLNITIKGEAWPVYLSSGIKCSRCHGQGHRRANCPLLAGRTTAPGPATPTSPTSVPPATAPRLPQQPSTQPPPPASPSPTMEVSDVPPTSRAALHPPAALRQSPPAPSALRAEDAPPAPPPVNSAPSLRTPGSREPAAPTPDVEMSIVEETSASSASSAKNATRVDLDAFIEKHPSVSFAGTEALGLGREEVLDLLSSRTKAQRKGPLLSPPQCDALAGLTRQILDLRPGAASNLYKVLGKVKAELRTTPTAVSPTPPLPAPRPAEPTPPAPHGKMTTPAMATSPSPLFQVEEDLTSKRWDEAADIIYKLCNERYSGPLTDLGITEGDITDAVIYPEDREPLLRTYSTQKKNLITEIISAAIERARDSDPFGRKRRRGSANSPTAAAPSSNAGGSRTIRRPQPSAGSVPRAQEIRVTRAHIAEARARQASSSEEHCVYIEHSPELEPFHYLRALDRMLGGTAGVIQITKVNGHQLLGLTNSGLAERLISEGLEVEGTLLRAFPFRKRAERITVGNLPFFIGDSAVINALSPYGRVTSIAPKQMKAGPYVYVDGRRDVFITLHEGITIERLPTRLDINIKGEAWPAYLSSGIRCSRCHGQGHRRAICPLLAGLANNTRMAPPTTPAGVPPPTTPAPPQRSAAQPPAPTPSNPAMEVCGAPPVARAALHSSAPRPSPTAAPAFPMKETPPAPPPVTPAPSLRTPGSREPAAPTPDEEMSIVEETFASSTSSAKNATRVDLDAFIEGHPSVSFAKTDALGLGREEVLDLLSSRTKAQRKGPLLSPPQCDALVGLIGQILDLRPGAASNLYKVLGQVKAELRTTPAVPPTPTLPAPRPARPTAPAPQVKESTPAMATPPPPPSVCMEDDSEPDYWTDMVDSVDELMRSPGSEPILQTFGACEFVDAARYPERREFSPLASNGMLLNLPSSAPPGSSGSAGQEPGRPSIPSPTGGKKSKKIDSHREIYKENSISREYVNPPADGGNASLAAARVDVISGVAATSSSNGAALAIRNWADCDEVVNPGTDDDFTVVKTKKRRRESSNSPTAATPSSNSGRARSGRRVQSSARSVPRAQEIPTTRAHIAEARARQTSSTEDHCVYIERSPELEPYHYMRALDRMLGGTREVVQMTKMNGHFLGEAWPAYLSSGIRCSRCRGQGHRRANCPMLAGRTTAPGPATPTSPTSVPPATAPRLPQQPSARPPPPASPSSTMEVSDVPPASRAAPFPPAALQPSPPAPSALPLEDTPPAPPPVTPAASLRTPGSREPAAPTPDVEMSIVEETFASSTSSAKNATRVDLDAFIEGHPSVSFAETDALGLGREEVLDFLSSRTKAQRKGPLLSPPQCDALVGLIGQILDLRPGAASNLYKVLGQVKSELRTTPAVPPTSTLPASWPAKPTPPALHGEKTSPDIATPPPPLSTEFIDACYDQANDIIYELSDERYSEPLSDIGVTEGDIVEAIIFAEDREPLFRRLSTQKRTILTEIIGAAIERARNSDPFNKCSIYLSTIENHANSPAGGKDANSATSFDFAIDTPFNGAIKAQRSWTDSSKDVNPASGDGFTVVHGKKRRRGSAESPVTAAHSSNASRSGFYRRQRSSTERVPRAQEIKTTRTHIVEARARQASSTEEQCLYVEHCPEFEPYHYLKAIDEMVGGTSDVVQVTKMNGHCLMLPSSKPFYLYGRVTSIVPKQLEAGKYVYTDGRREAFIVPHDGMTIESIPARLDIRIKGEAWPMYLTSGIRCSRCRGQGHRRANCPLLTGQFTGPRRASPSSTTNVPQVTAPELPRQASAASPAPPPPDPAMEDSGVLPAASAAPLQPAVPGQPPPAPMALPIDTSTPAPAPPAPSREKPSNGPTAHTAPQPAEPTPPTPHREESTQDIVTPTLPLWAPLTQEEEEQEELECRGQGHRRANCPLLAGRTTEPGPATPTSPTSVPPATAPRLPQQPSAQPPPPASPSPTMEVSDVPPASRAAPLPPAALRPSPPAAPAFPMEETPSAPPPVTPAPSLQAPEGPVGPRPASPRHPEPPPARPDLVAPRDPLPAQKTLGPAAPTPDVEMSIVEETFASSTSSAKNATRVDLD